MEIMNYQINYQNMTLIIFMFLWTYHLRQRQRQRQRQRDVYYIDWYFKK